MNSATIVEQSPVQRLVWVVHLVRDKKGFTYDKPSMPGHHIQIVSHGRVRMETAGRAYELGRGAAIWFHENELVHGHVLEAPWKFYAIHFLAPSLPPPDFEARCRQFPPRRILGLAETLLRTWLRTSVPPLVRLCCVQSDLLRLLALVLTPSQHAVRVGQDSALWWQVENELRKDLGRAIEVATMSALVKRSPATITRSCRQAVGVSPLQRLKQLRMSMGRCLVWTSRLTFSEIAYRVGYARVHEFSRDYHKCHGLTPTEDREQFPRIYRREFRLPFTAESEAS
jgi:AraC-like DNA-binding protein